MSPRPVRQPSLFQSLLPLLCLAIALATGVYLFSDNASSGANQVSLMLAGGVAAIIGIRNGLKWDDIQEGMVHGISLAIGPIFILLAVGALIGTWILSGTVPTMIVYGLKLLHPSYFYPAACLICAIVGLVIGSSWTVAGTLGVALIGVAQGLDMSPAVTAGAVISGGYFGDKISPLSDTTNIAPAAAGSELFSHIRHMLWTTVPSIVIALILFTVIGLGEARELATDQAFGNLPQVLGQQFSLGAHLLIPMVVVFALAITGFPAYPSILIGALLGAVFAVVFQPDVVLQLADNEALSRPMALLAGAWTAMFDGYHGQTGVGPVDDLLSRGGMISMLNTIWLIICAMGFGAVMERAGLLERMIRSVLKAARSAGSLIAATLATAIGANIVAADQYMAIVLTGRLFAPEYKRRGLAPVNLSRALEDGGTITSPLVPWNTCGAYMAATLGVATMDYLPYAFFNLVGPLVAVVSAYAGFKILMLPRTASPAPVPSPAR
ncbi:Na+/H+ antiporter NhaC [Lysobacter sp. H23M47]|uniref:Na+/H+ antiporter NhaC n=1 Tax=Lysobacter sp. H23M47 TaxID=2781024 RepID=UPI001881568B|nr:Na+/H+ antiporter NhaC [Lysobacter sp. H23M47]QOW25488.1 Na+/H+ antiporter NhaC [Lysobacter sp. H23M47]